MDIPHIITYFIIFRNGDEWHKLRSSLQKGFSTNDALYKFISYTNEVAEEFVQKLPFRADSNSIIGNFFDELERYSMEVMYYIVFGIRMNSFTEIERKSNSVSSKLIKATKDHFLSIARTDQFPHLWRYFDTYRYKKMKSELHVAEDFVQNIISKELNKESIVKNYFNNSKLHEKEIFGSSVDTMLNNPVVVITLSSILFHISKNRRVQDLMYEEAKNLLPNADDFVDQKILDHEIPYTRAVFKEALRLNPLTIGVSRILTSDKILRGYFVPKNVICF